MSKNRTMAQKNAKVVQYAIAGGKTALAADAYNEAMAGLIRKGISGVDLYNQHARYMKKRPKKRNKWEAVKA